MARVHVVVSKLPDLVLYQFGKHNEQKGINTSFLSLCVSVYVLETVSAFFISPPISNHNVMLMHVISL